MNDPQPVTRRMVVGVDGSDGSRTALRLANAPGALSGATVEAVIAWQEPVMYGAASMGYLVPEKPGDIEKSMTAVLDDTIERAGLPARASADVVSMVIQGHPAEVLLRQAAGAELLVVGSRGHGTFAALLLGSVGQHCVQHAPCPVVVVPA